MPFDLKELNVSEAQIVMMALENERNRLYQEIDKNQPYGSRVVEQLKWLADEMTRIEVKISNFYTPTKSTKDL